MPLSREACEYIMIIIILSNILFRTTDRRLIKTMEACEEMNCRMELIYGSTDREDNNLLHMAIHKTRTELIAHFADKPVDPKARSDMIYQLQYIG